MNVLYQRSPRIKPALKEEQMEILRPPGEPTKPSFSMISIILPMVMTMGTVGFYIYMNLSGKMGNSNFIMFQMITTVMMLMSYILPFFIYIGNKKKYREQVSERNRMYLAELDKHREELKEGMIKQVNILYDNHGDPDICFQTIKNRSSSLWERSPEDDDFLDVRIGYGELPFYIKVKVPRSDGYEKDPLIEAAEEVEKEFKTVPDSSIVLPLYQAKVIGIVGERDVVMNTLRVILSQVTVRHSPDEVKCAAFFDQEEAAEWDWMRWFSHTWDDQRSTRYLADRTSSMHSLADELFLHLNQRKNNRDEKRRGGVELPVYLVVLSNTRIIEEEPLFPLLMEDGEWVESITIVLSDRKETLPMECHLIVEVEQNQGMYTLKKDDGTFEQQSFKPDKISLEKVSALARYMAPIRLKRSSASDIPSVLPLFEMMDIKSVEELGVKDRWKKNRYPDTLPVPIGVRVGGKKIYLNLHDKIERAGHGPHGLIAGTTGSGKSEVIQSIVASLAAEFHPHDLAFMLIDYKGGGMSNTFENLPHVVGTITNLSSGLMERAKISLKAELVRRQNIFNEEGNLQHIDEYYKRLKHQSGKPLPHLVIIIDEFAQLKKDQPEFMDELISIAAIGRTLGVHLILATQKPAGVVDDKIWSNSRFRICLRVQDEGDSRDMLKIPNAAWVKNPGRGYFQVGSNEVFEEMQFAWSGAPYIAQESIIPGGIPSVSEIHLNGQREAIVPTGLRVSGLRAVEFPKQLQVFIDYLAQSASEEGIERLQGPWLPPLPESVDLSEVTEHSESQLAQYEGMLIATAGIIDDLPNQSQKPFILPMQQGHWVIYGMPGLGKTTLIQTILISLANRYNPSEWHGYIVDMGRTMRDFSELPHVGAVLLGEDEDRIKRLFRFLVKTIAQRKEMFVEAGVKTIAAYRRHQAVQLPQIIVVIDGYVNFHGNYPDENEVLEFILREGGSLGITFIISCNRVSDVFEKIRSNIPNAVTFELADTGDYYYAVGRPSKAPSHLPPGRGLVKGHHPPLEFQAALPSQGVDENERSRALRNTVSGLKEGWKGDRVPPILPLPEKVYLQELFGIKEDGVSTPHDHILYNVPVGLIADDLEPYYVNLEEGPHFIVASPMEGGKTSFLMTWILSLAFHVSPEKLQIFTIDARHGSHGLYQLKDLPHVVKASSRDEELKVLIQQLHNEVESREHDGEFPVLMLVIDDADVLAKQLQDLTVKDQLNSIVRMGRDRKVHVILSGVPADFPTFGVDWFNNVKSSQSGFLFGTLDPNDLSFFRIPFTESVQSSGGLKVLPPGQGYYIKRKFVRVKGAIPYNNQWNKDRWIKEICDRWHVVV